MWYSQPKKICYMKITIVAALQSSDNPKLNRGIGKDNKLLFRLPPDIKRLKKLTLGLPVIMGRLTYESLPDDFRPLPGRKNIVISKNPQFKPHKDVEVVESLAEAIKYASTLNDEDVFIIGGGQIYKEAINSGVVDRLELTLIKGKEKADTFFPEFENFGKITDSSSFHYEEGDLDYQFITIEKNK